MPEGKCSWPIAKLIPHVCKARRCGGGISARPTTSRNSAKPPPRSATTTSSVQTAPSTPDPRFSRGTETPTRDVDPGFSRGMEGPAKDIDPGFSWVQAGPNRWRNQRAEQRPLAQTVSMPAEQQDDGAVLDKGLAGPDDGSELIDIDSKARSQRRQWERREGRPWPTTETGRNYDRSHIIAKGDGGPDTLENIRPQHPVEHRQDHMAKGDFKRWGAWGRGGPKVNGLAWWQLPSDILGMISGRIRTDSFDNLHERYAGFAEPGGHPAAK